jgi:hypothetical protein
MDANEAQKREVAKQRTAYNELQNEVVRLKEEMKRVTSSPSLLPAPPRPAKLFTPSTKKGGEFEVPDAIIGHLTRVCGGNVHQFNIVDVTSGWFEKTGSGPQSGALKQIADLAAESYFYSAYRSNAEDIGHTRNN